MKKIKVSYGMWDFYFSKGDWENIKARFDLRNKKKKIIMGKWMIWIIDIPCSLCKKYYKPHIYPESRCRGCTFNKIGWSGTGRNPCLRLVKQILGETIQVSITTEKVKIERGKPKEFAQVRKIHKTLINAEKEC